MNLKDIAASNRNKAREKTRFLFWGFGFGLTKKTKIFDVVVGLQY